MFLEGHAIIVLMLEPHGINGLLDDGVLIFVERIPTRIVFLRAYKDQRTLNGNAMEANTINKRHLRQQLICVSYIVAYAPRSLIRVKLI
jgi:hypothetical protein